MQKKNERSILRDWTKLCLNHYWKYFDFKCWSPQNVHWFFVSGKKILWFIKNGEINWENNEFKIKFNFSRKIILYKSFKSIFYLQTIKHFFSKSATEKDGKFFSFIFKVKWLKPRRGRKWTFWFELTVNFWYSVIKSV